MLNKNQIQSYTSNFPNLQGLKAIPLSLLLWMMVVWANQQSGPNITLPILIIFSMLMFYAFVDRYYKLSYGTIFQTGQKKASEIIFSAIAGILTLAAFVLDASQSIPVSLVGLAWAAMLIFDGFRISRSMPQQTFPFYWIFAIILLVASVISVFGFVGWWEALGVNNLLSAVLIVASILMLISGVIWHIFFLQSLKVGE